MANGVTDFDADNRDDSFLSTQTLLLLEALNEKDELLGRMLYGSWYSVNDTKNPEAYPQAAHSIRELMEKAPDLIPDVPVKQGTGSLSEDVRVLHEAWKIIKSGAWKSAPPWKGSIDNTLESWLGKAETFFEDFGKNHETRKQQVAKAITALDKSGQPLPAKLIEIRVKEWGELSKYFMKIAHHGAVADPAEFELEVQLLEEFLLSLIHPQPIPVMDELDALIAEGESS